MSPAGLLALLLAVLGAGCEVQGVFVAPEPSLERMIVQPRMDPYRANPLFSDGRAMRPTPAGTIDRSRTVGQLEISHGINSHGYVPKIPIPITRALVERGRDRFEIFCAACHGILGDGQ